MSRVEEVRSVFSTVGRPWIVSPDEVDYPYATSNTYEFLKQAISEKAYLNLPERFKRLKNGELAWLRMRIVTWFYYSTPLNYSDLDELFGFRRARSTSQELISKFMKHLWKNCSEETQSEFPYEQIRLAKPNTSVDAFRKSLRQGGTMVEIFPLFEKGLSLLEVSRLSEINYLAVASSQAHLRKYHLIAESREARNKRLKADSNIS